MEEEAYAQAKEEKEEDEGTIQVNAIPRPNSFSFWNNNALMVPSRTASFEMGLIVL